MSRGRKGYNVILTSLQTGSKYEFSSGREASEFLGRTKAYIQTCVYKGFQLKHKYTGEYFTCDYTSKKQRCKPAGYTEQPCYTCAKFCGGCAWSERFEPVEGWEAIPTVIKQQWGREIPSFAILHCPQYERG